MAWKGALLLVLPLARACSSLRCEDSSNDPTTCFPNKYADERADSVWHVRVLGSQGSCVVEEAPKFTKSQSFIDVEVIEVVYSDVGELQLSVGEEVRLDFGSSTSFVCTGAPDELPIICFNSCGPIISDVFEHFLFEMGSEYVVHVNEMPRPARPGWEELYEYEAESPSSAQSPTNSESKDVCGQESRFYLASANKCDNNLVAPTAAQLKQLRSACGVCKGDSRTQFESGGQTSSGAASTARSVMVEASSAGGENQKLVLKIKSVFILLTMLALL